MERIDIGIDGFNTISNGGLPKVKTTLVTGTSGSGKTVFAAQFIAAGIIQKDDHGVFITFEERPSDIRTNIASLGWNVEKWEEEKKWAFVDASSVIGEESIIAGDYNFSALLARIEHAVKKVNARRLSMDSLGSVFSQFSDANIVRKELFNISAALKQMGVTSIITTERSEEYGEIARFGIEEFVVDNVIILRNVLENEKRRRTMEILKFRGTHHQKGEFPFTITKDIGIVTIPLSGIELKQRSSNIRISSGNTVLNNMCGGGFFQNSIILVSGATGCGKTLLATEFAAEGGKNNERSLVVAYEESRDQIYRNAAGWGIDFEKLEKKGLLKVVCNYPESKGLEDHYINITNEVIDFKPRRVVVDSLSALERVSTKKGFSEFIIALTSFIKHHEIAGFFTSTTSDILGGSSITDTHISNITDTIILLRYLEIFGEIFRGLTVMKMRGSTHEKLIRNFSINEHGMEIKKPFRNISGIFTGHPTISLQDDADRVLEIFKT